MGLQEGTLDFLHHMSLPLVCFMASEFAFLTMLMKNSLLEEIRKEYVRTALFKGAGFGQAVWKHALRNALIPLATRMSEIFYSHVYFRPLDRKSFRYRWDGTFGL